MPASRSGDKGLDPLEPVALAGGMNRIRRIGDTVVRPAGVYTPTVHRLLNHLADVGFVGSPKPLDLNPTHETLTFVPGETTNYPLAPSFRTDSALISAAEVLRHLHDSSASFLASTDDVWFRPGERPTEVVCHGDFAPYNCCVEAGRVVGVFDFDTAHWGPRLSDVGYAAYRWVPISCSAEARWLDDLGEQRRRLHLFCAAYGTDQVDQVLRFAVSELRTLVGTMQQLAADGSSAFARHLDEGHDRLYLADIDYINANAATLAAMPPSDYRPA